MRSSDPHQRKRVVELPTPQPRRVMNAEVVAPQQPEVAAEANPKAGVRVATERGRVVDEIERGIGKGMTMTRWIVIERITQVWGYAFW